MSFAVGKKLGVFELSTLLGVGGMGEVYRALDTKLGREVAIKVLPDEFARDRDRLARFQREARLLAALNHPNIAHIHDLLEADGQHFLVMELVEGETLADRILRGPLPLEDVLKYFGQIAEGLEAAHQQGVIHRDLKPANIKITDEGKVSVLDFGLAKATEIQRTATNDGVTSPWDDNSAGKSSLGQIVGTPAYMSPEQARGKVVDKRTDIWAFGCCLYEALTGQRSFRGETVSDTLAMILKSEPDWKALPANSPLRLRELLRSCLAKDLRHRARDIGDIWLEFDRIGSNPNLDLVVTPLPAGTLVVRRPWLVVGILGSLLVGTLGGAALWNAGRSAAFSNQPAEKPQAVVRTMIDLPRDAAIAINPEFSYNGTPQVALSPDSKQLVFVGGKEGETKLYVRPMDGLEPVELPGTEGAESPFFKPDGQWVGFASQRKLKMVRIDGSQVVDLCEVQNLRGGSWGHDGMIYFADSATRATGFNDGLKRVRVTGGGEPELITDKQDGPKDLGSPVYGYSAPFVLPDGKTLLFTMITATLSHSSAAILTIETGRWEVLVRGARFAQYVPTGHLLFYDRGSFYAVRFDADRLKIVGRPVKIVRSSFLPAVSNAGCFVHGSPSAWESVEGLPNSRRLVWVNRDSTTERLRIPAEPYTDVRLSPDNNRLAVEVTGDRGIDIWIYDLKHETTPPTYLTSAGRNTFPVWTPDGLRVIFTSLRDDGRPSNLFWAPADGSAKPLPLTDCDNIQVPISVSPQGVLAITQISNSTGYDIYALRLGDDGPAEPVLKTKFNESYATFSPRGDWLAYSSDHIDGRREVFVQKFPITATSLPYQISQHGGAKPLWSKNGNELFYRSGSFVYSAKIETEPVFKVQSHDLLFDSSFVNPVTRRGYDLSDDDERFLFMELTEEEAAQGPVDKLFVVQNWFEELKRLAPAEGPAEKPAR